MRTLWFSLLLAASTSAYAGPTTQTYDHLGLFTLGETAPPLSGFTADGQLFRSRMLLDGSHGLVVSFFQTTCAPCAIGLPKLIAAVNATQGRYRIVLIDVGERPELLNPFVKKLGLNVPIVLDATRALTTSLGLDESLPRTVVIGADGKVRAAFGEEGVDFDTLLTQALNTP
jgi:peroxiredoxin